MKTTAALLLLLVLAQGKAFCHTDLTPAEVNAWLGTGEPVTVVDVREESEFCDSTYVPPGHIPGAINMPWNSGYFQIHYAELAQDDDIIMVCRSGNRSNSAANFLDALGFSSVFDMTGGMNQWVWETEVCAPAGVPQAPDAGTPHIALSPAAPNPFASETEIRYTIGATSADVRFGIYDARGRLVREMVAGSHARGEARLTWDGKDEEGLPLSSGVYFYRLSSDGLSMTRRVVLLR
jgi:phage shock protein E